MKVCADKLSKPEDPQGNLVFGPTGVNDKAIKKRFERLMAFVKKMEGAVPFQSGCNNQEESELQEALEACTNFGR
jgi:hypothetical protein